MYVYYCRLFKVFKRCFYFYHYATSSSRIRRV